MSYDISSSLTYFTQYQSLGPSILLQMAVFHAFNGWVVFHCMCVYICVCVCVVYIHIYTPHLLYPFLCQWTGRLLPRLGCCKQCCGEHWVACIFSNYVFLQIYAQEVFVHCVLYILYINKVCAYTHTHTHTHTPLFSGKLVAKHLPVYHHHPHLFGPQWKWRTFATVLLMKLFHSFLFSKWNSLWFIDLSLLVLYSVFEVCTPGHMIVFQRGDDPCWVGWETAGGAWKERELAVRRLGSLPCRRMSSWVIPSIISF